MNQVLETYFEQHVSITNKRAQELGIGRHTLSNLVKKGELSRIKQGLYRPIGDLVDEFVAISANSRKIIFSYQTALFLQGLSERTPSDFHVTVPQGYNIKHVKDHFPNLIVHYVKKELFELGIREVTTPLGNTVKVYESERLICELIASRSKIDSQTYTYAIKHYFSNQKKDLRKLIKYSRLFKVEDEVRKYSEVLG